MEKITENVLLVGVETEENYRNFSSSMHELHHLTETAGGKVVYELTQKKAYVDRKTVIGKGKVEELIQWVDYYEAEVVIFNHELTPRQNQLLAEKLNIKVIDRVQLILDIFAMRARSKEGKLQVELAQLNYLLPRLIGQGKQLSRLGGGIGTRGPGETKLESDRRHIRHKITAIQRELKEVTAHRERSRLKRQSADLFQIGLIGYTNAGKSTILNVLTEAKTYSKDQLFATLDPLTKKWELPQGMIVTLTDTVGFIQDLPTQLIEAFQSTLEESRTMDLLLHVVDASSENRLQHEQTVINLLNNLQLAKIPVLTVYNKFDKVEEELFVPTQFPYVCTSTKKINCKEEITKSVREQMLELFEPYELSIEASKGYLLSALASATLLLSSEFDDEKEVFLVKGFAKKGTKWVNKQDDV